MTTFERRQRILALLRQQPGLRVPEMAALLEVSEGTVRNDLNALAEARQLTRVRGGAVPADEAPYRSPAFAARARINETAKQNLARWAAALVEDGDSILLDASTTVYHIAVFLQDRRNLTVVTNGIEVGRRLAQNPSNSVILLGGVLRADSTSVSGPLSERCLRDFHVKTAFVSCTGFSLDGGLTEVDIAEAHLKSRMIGAADSVVALIDSSKFGRMDLTPFAQLRDISRIFTDNQLDRTWSDALKRTPVVLTICGENSVSSHGPDGEQAPHYRIGFANLSEQVPFAVEVRRGLERAAQEAGNIELILADNQLDGQVAVRVAESLIAERVDLAIEYQVDFQAGDVIMSRFREAGIPVVAVDIPMVGATFCGVDNYGAGNMAGLALGNWIRDHWAGGLDCLVVLEEPRTGPLPAARIRGQLDGLQSVVGQIPPEKMICLNSGNCSEISELRSVEVLNGLSGLHRLAFITFNDEAALGAIAAGRRLGRDADMVVVGQGAERLAREEMARPRSPLIGSTAYTPERYGRKLIALALKILKGEPVAPAVYMDHVFVEQSQEYER